MSYLVNLIDLMDEAYPPELAADWDAVGLVCGDPGDEIERIMFAVDATERVVAQALHWGAQALVVHHPLLLRGVTGIAADTPKGGLVHRLVRGGCALFTAHTNADAASPGVSDALATDLGLHVLGPIEAEQLHWDKIAVTVPRGADADRVRDALHGAGAGRVGNYSQVAFGVSGLGQFRPGPDAEPTIGESNRLELVAEERIEVVAPRALRAAAVTALVAAHPYEEPAYDVVELAPRPGRRGLGRVCELPEPETLRAFTHRVGARLPETAWGVRAAGDPDRLVRTIAVCGGAGDSLLGRVHELGVDAFVTADLRHHPVDEHLRAGGPALVDVAHWASEEPWCRQAAQLVDLEMPGTVTHVSTVRTDPWTLGAGKQSQSTRQQSR